MQAVSVRWRDALFRHDAYWLRRLAYLGARYGSTSFAKHSPTAIGAIFAGILPGYRQRIRANLRRIYGQRSTWQELRDVTRTFVAYAYCLAESLGSDRVNPGCIKHKILGRDNLDAAVSLKSGFIVATAHVGAWDSAATKFASRNRTFDIGCYDSGVKSRCSSLP